MNFTHLNQKQRYQIEARLALGQSKSAIALALGVHPVMIYRECRRGESGGPYNAAKAQAGARRRGAHRAANHPVKPDALWALVREGLAQDWSPAQIAGRLRLTGRSCTISAQRIYDWLRRQTRTGALAGQ